MRWVLRLLGMLPPDGVPAPAAALTTTGKGRIEDARRRYQDAIERQERLAVLKSEIKPTLNVIIRRQPQ